jgi:DNA replication protein DnaC
MDLMSQLKLVGMKSQLDDILGRGRKRQRPVEEILAELLTAEVADKRMRSIRYQLGVAKLPLAKELADFVFDDIPLDQALIDELASGGFLEQQRNVVLIGGTGTGKSHLAIAIARACIRNGAKGRFFNVVDLVNKLEAEAKSDRPGRIADALTRVDLVVLDELTAVPSRQPPLRAHLNRRHHQSRLRGMAAGVRRRQDDDRFARPPYPSLRDHRNRQ